MASKLPDTAPVVSGQELSQADFEHIQSLGLRDLFFFTRGILGYQDVNPRVHRDLCSFITDDSSLRRLVLMPRSHFKTTVATIGDSIRLIAQNPNIRILFGNESGKNVELMLGEVKDHFIQNPRLRAFYPYIIPKNINETTWSKSEILIPRDLIAREPTISTIGTGGAVVSRHFNRFKFDDLIGEEAFNSPSVMEKAISWLNHSVSLLIEPSHDVIDLVGTRWAYNDLYNHAIDSMGFKVFRKKAVVINPETNETEPLFNARFSMSFFEGIIQNDPGQWAAQYANDPSDISFADFQKSWLRFYKLAPDGNLRWEDDDGTLNIQDLSKLRIYIHVDPSLGETIKSDESAVVTVGINSKGQVFVLDAWLQRIDPVNLSEKIFDMNERFSPKLISIEANAFQKSLRYFIDAEAARRHTYLHIEDYLASNKKTKEARIRGALQPYFSTGQIFIRANQTDLLEQYLQFGRTDRDHLMDALAQGPKYWKTPFDEQAQRRHREIKDKLLSTQNRGLTGYGI